MIRPEQAAMVAAHAYDLRAAKKLGIRTIYVHRKSEDLDEDMDQVRAEVDMFVDGTKPEAGLAELAERL
jgi:FMN phosphatase YigB (HAD superfamily)